MDIVAYKETQHKILPDLIIPPPEYEHIYNHYRQTTTTQDDLWS